MILSTHFPQSKEGKRFCEFFDFRFSFIVASDSNEERPEWKTVSSYPIEHRNLWNRYCEEETLIGLSFGKESHYFLADIDRGSPYHPENDEAAFKGLLFVFEDVGFNDYVLVQSSVSGGIHVYFPLPKNVPTYKLAVLARQVALRSGFKVRDGILEFFPNPKAYGKLFPTSYRAHRLPLQRGSYLLDKDYVPYSDSIATFLDQVEVCAKAQDIADIEMAMEAAYHTRGFSFVKGDSGKAAAFAADLKEQIEEGWTEFGQTNDLLRIIGTYARVFEALGGDELASYIARTAKSLPGYTTFCRHAYHIEQRAREWARCIEKFYYPYGSMPFRAGTFGEMINEAQGENSVNDERQHSAIDRIKRGMEYLRETLLELPRRVGKMKEAVLQAVKTLFGVRPSDKTLYRYQELWHPDYILEGEASIHSTQKTITPLSCPQEVEPETESVLCHTPDEERENVEIDGMTEITVVQSDSPFSATPPLYMKVKQWAESQVFLIYGGNLVSGFVLLEGEKRQKVYSIHQNQQVLIDSYNHSSFLFYPEDESNLLVSVKPIEEQTTWRNGVFVRAKDLWEFSENDKFCLCSVEPRRTQKINKYSTVVI